VDPTWKSCNRAQGRRDRIGWIQPEHRIWRHRIHRQHWPHKSAGDLGQYWLDTVAANPTSCAAMPGDDCGTSNVGFWVQRPACDGLSASGATLLILKPRRSSDSTQTPMLEEPDRLGHGPLDASRSLGSIKEDAVAGPEGFERPSLWASQAPRTSEFDALGRPRR
jgi:hypothetical protein